MIKRKRYSRGQSKGSVYHSNALKGRGKRVRSGIAPRRGKGRTTHGRR